VTAFRAGLAVAMLTISSAACTSRDDASERFIGTGKRIAHLPASCIKSKATHYERVRNENFSDGESFIGTIDKICENEWMGALRDSTDFSCDEDFVLTDTLVGKKPMYSCFSGKLPLAADVNVVFHSNGAVELLWVVPK
jgi:hypothetical protein